MLASRGVLVKYVLVTSEGFISEKEFAALLSEKTVLVTFAYVNSEIGVVQEVKALSRAVRLFRKEHTSVYPYMHLDASQAPLYLPCRMDSLGIDLMSIDAGKCYGPKGAGVLAMRGAVNIEPVFFGGSQEGGLRPGTENVGLMVGCAKALEIAQKGYEARASRVGAMRDRFFTLLLKTFPNAVLNGSRAKRIANNLNISIPNVDGEYAVVGLDTRGISASTRSACRGNDDGGSHVIRALGAPEDVVFAAIRFSLSETTSKQEITRAVEALKAHLATTTF